MSLGTDSPPYEILTGTNPWPGVDVKQPHTSELAVIGSRLYARMNGKLVTVTDDRIADGMPGFLVRKASIRDVEVINLDGLSEAEALKIIGVDEKGNDVRAAAVPSP